MTKRALLYCRISDVKQSREGSGLKSQEHRCREYAAANGYPVDEVFTDEYTGGGDYSRRSGMMALLSRLKQNTKHQYVIIFDDLKRLGRDTRYYLELRDIISALGAEVECLNFKFDPTPEGEFHEEIIAATGKLERRQIARQTKQKTKARIEAGYHAFLAPVGFRFTKSKEHGKLLTRKEPEASVIAEAYEGFASGRFQTKQEVRYFLEAHPKFPKGPSGKIGNNRVDKILTNPLYAGYVGYEPWGISLREGKHQGVVSYATFVSVQERLQGRAYAPTRKNLHIDFPLRGSVVCECGNALTAGNSRGKMGKYYSYYNCQNRKCKHGGKSIRKVVIESEFEDLLKSLTPSTALITAASRMFKTLWDHRAATQSAAKSTYERELVKLDAQVEKAIDKMLETDSVTATKGLEQRIDKLEEKKLLVRESIANCSKPVRSFDEMYRTSMEFLSNPYKTWVEGEYEQKKLVLKLVLTDRITYIRNQGYRLFITNGGHRGSLN